MILYFYYLDTDLNVSNGNFRLCVDVCEVKETKTRYMLIGKSPYEYEYYKKNVKKTDIGKMICGYSCLRTILTERNDTFVRQMFSDYMTKCINHVKKQLEIYQRKLKAIETMDLGDE